MQALKNIMQQIQFISKEENSIIYVTVLSSLGYAA
jgi:hypothetical protein